LNGLAAYAGFSDGKLVEVLRAIDKLDKQGWEAVNVELTGPTVEGCVGLSDEQASAIKRFLDLRAGTHRETLRDVEQLMQNAPMAQEGIRELREIVEHVAALGVPDDKWSVDLSVARGLGYYTGPVFETILADLPSIGSVFSGGRYDDLVRRFGAVDVPATGASVGVDRIFAAMEQLKLVKRRKTTASVLILNFEPACETACEEVATTLRHGGISTEVYIGREKTLKGQLAFAVSQEYPFVVIIGSAEQEQGIVKLKEMAARRQHDVPRASLLTEVQKLL
jgi:histidyl-tRNA synthetase